MPRLALASRTTTSCSWLSRLILCFAQALFACQALVACHSHEHAPHGKEGHEEATEEAEPIAITKWTAHYELFVELPPPVVGQPVAYHAHVTRLSDFFAVREGRFTARWKQGGAVIVEHAVDGAKRPGIFVFEGPSPPVGEYQVEMSYAFDGKTDTWDCGAIAVVATPPKPGEEASADEGITFLKESQWKIPFRTAWSEERDMSEVREFSAVVEPAGSDTLTLSAPTTGRFLHEAKRALSVGMHLEKGDVVGRLLPTVAGEDYSRLVFAVDEGRTALAQNTREVARVEPLVKEGVLPEKRLIELRNEAETLRLKLRSAEGRMGTIGTDAAGGVSIKAGISGIVSDVVVPNGESVEAGAPLVRLGGTERLWLRVRFFPRGPLDDASPLSLRLSSGREIDLTKTGARFLSKEPSIDPETRVASWVVDLGEVASDAELRTGAAVVVRTRVGKTKRVVAVPNGAVVEISTRTYAFLQMDGEHFEKRAIRVGPSDGEYMPILEGIAKDERVVTLGGFDIHLAAVMGTVESHRH